MGKTEYQEALKLGKREQRNCLAHGHSPYLPVLDEILLHNEIQAERPLGLMQIPLENVIGTSTRGRTYAFAANFMPIMNTETEFAFKWERLSDIQLEEGIRDPIITYEYMNRYYVVEGNKRVSVLKYYNAVSIPAIVTRKVPKYSEDEDVKRYYEFMDFQRITGLNTIEFSQPGRAQRLLELMGKTEKWDDATKEDFTKIMFEFSRAYKNNGGDRLSITPGDALVAFVDVFGYENMLAMTEEDYQKNMIKVWKEFVIQTEKDNVDLVMNPQEIREKRSPLKYFLPEKNLTVAFLYPKTIEESDWIYAHELGRNYLENTFPEKIHTICVENVTTDNLESVLDEVIADGANIIMEIAPQMMALSMKVAVEHPEVKILNCSLNTPHKAIRTYYARMYEAKFISGMVAGAMTENNKIAYVADYPIYGMIANINAFALGAACVNPRAKIYLEWSTKKGYNLDKFLTAHDIHYVSNQDMVTPISESRAFGLYKYENGENTNLVMPIWNWGIFYEKMIRSIYEGKYQSEDSEEGKALNYWWGMSAGVIDLICSNHVPAGVQRLAKYIEHNVRAGDLVPFYGEIRAQDGSVKNREDEEMTPFGIMEMDWLVENVVGEIPAAEQITDDAKSVVEIKGVGGSKKER